MAQGINDIFGYKRNPKPSAVFSTEDSMLTFGSTNVGSGQTEGNTIGYLVQSWNCKYSQQVSELFEIGSNALFWSKGRPSGAGILERIIGLKDADNNTSGKFFPPEAYDICKGGALVNISAQGGHCDATTTTQSANKTLTIGMDGVLVTNLGFSMTVADTMIGENIGWRFAAMSVDNS